MFNRLLRIPYRIFELKHTNIDIGKPFTCNEYSKLFLSYKSFCDNQKNIDYTFYVESKSEGKDTHKYVGALEHNKEIFFTPNKSTSILRLTKNKSSNVGSLSATDYKWTGECVYKNKIYFFPRKESDLLYLDVTSDRFEPSYLKGPYYGREHHYGGVRYNNLIIQPPRSSESFLIWNLNTGEYSSLKICPSLVKKLCRYSCSVYHPNGYIYFFPENGRVIKFNPINNKWSFVGQHLNTMIFDAKIAADSNIYGFSINAGGIVKYDVEYDNVEILFPEQYFGAYGTKLGINGMLYSVPGSGSCVWCFDYVTNSIRCIYDLNDSSYAKYAGGCTRRNGDIVCAPSFAEHILYGKPSLNVAIPENIYSWFYNDCY